MLSGRMFGWSFAFTEIVRELIKANYSALLVFGSTEAYHAAGKNTGFYRQLLDEFRETDVRKKVVFRFHVFASSSSFPDARKGGRSFALLKVLREEATPADKIISFCRLLRGRFAYTPLI